MWLNKLGKAEAKKPIVGPDADEGWREKTPEMYTLAGGLPLYVALLSNPSAPVPLDEEIVDAKAYLNTLFERYRNEAIACQGMSVDEARAILMHLPRVSAARLQ